MQQHNVYICCSRTDTSKALILGIKYDKTDGNYKTREGETVTYFNWAEGEFNNTLFFNNFKIIVIVSRK